jgi:hypothetical protein
MAEAGEQATGTKDENYDVISVLYHSLQAASEIEQYISDAEEAGDQELVEFFRDYQESQRDFSERAKNLLGARLMRTGGEAGAGGKKLVVDATPGVKKKKGKQAGTQTNAQMKSGGRASDDIVDEQSKESFPASDSPAKY